MEVNKSIINQRKIKTRLSTVWSHCPERSQNNESGKGRKFYPPGKRPLSRSSTLWNIQVANMMRLVVEETVKKFRASTTLSNEERIFEFTDPILYSSFPTSHTHQYIQVPLQVFFYLAFQR